jgi:HNH endonuclease
MDPRVIEKFWNSIEKTEDCWLWVGPLTTTGTPTNRNFNPKKLSLEITGMSYPTVRQVYNTCHNKLCVNPDHLVVGDSERFWHRVMKTENCWTWLGSKDKAGYGKFVYYLCNKKQHIRCHQFSYLITYGTLQGGQCVRHLCNNRICVRPEHLALGSNQDNMDDKVRSNRQIKGEQHHNAKLDKWKVKEIRELYATGNYSQQKLSDLFNVAQSTIKNVLLRRTWIHVD